MKAKVNLRVEIIDGEDAGYILEETNRVVELQESFSEFPEAIKPYRITVEFITPDMIRRHMR